jgi:hypothetical protein
MTALALGVIAFLGGLFLLWRTFFQDNEIGSWWSNNKNLILWVSSFLILRGGFNLIKYFL